MDVIAPDGATITVESIGAGGPGLVVVNGGAVSARLYRRFAQRLDGAVHLFNRRNRPGSADLPPGGYSVQVDIDDIAAVMAATGATMLFGHSIGGFIALRAALELPVTKLALYDPAVVVDDLMPTAHVDEMARAVKARDYPLAMAVASRGLRSAGALSNLPLPTMKAMAKLFFRTPIGRDWLDTFHTVPDEVGESIKHAGPASLYSGVKAEVFLASGAGSPPYYAPINRSLAEAIPGARAIVIPGSRHDAPNVARPAFMRPFIDFLR